MARVRVIYVSDEVAVELANQLEEVSRFAENYSREDAATRAVYGLAQMIRHASPTEIEGEDSRQVSRFAAGQQVRIIGGACAGETGTLVRRSGRMGSWEVNRGPGRAVWTYEHHLEPVEIGG